MRRAERCCRPKAPEPAHRIIPLLDTAVILFQPYPEVYFSRLWRLLSLYGYIKVFLAEYEGEVVSALVVLVFRDTAYTLGIGWSGRHGKCRPNEVLYWSAITWAKAHGYPLLRLHLDRSKGC